jgi:hypothetical protein
VDAAVAADFVAAVVAAAAGLVAAVVAPPAGVLVLSLLPPPHALPTSATAASAAVLARKKPVDFIRDVLPRIGSAPGTD